ncbi:hypothetical protein [uncultured Clostridium sp.]|nr:hypothetical protein [uncultured Clostridium sp.]
MEGFNWWGISIFVMPIVLAITIGLMVIVKSILDGVSKFIKIIKR